MTRSTAGSSMASTSVPRTCRAPGSARSPPSGSTRTTSPRSTEPGVTEAARSGGRRLRRVRRARTHRVRSARSDIDAGPAGPDRGAVGLARLEASGIRRRLPSGSAVTADSARHLPAAPIAALDRGSRERWALGLQRSAGNRSTSRALARAAVQRDAGAASATDTPSAWDLGPNPYAIETPGGGAKRRELDANPYAGENDPVTLSNPRFAKVPQLGKIAGV